MIINPRITTAVNNIVHTLMNITKLFILGLQICVIQCNGDRWSLLRKFSHMNINTPSTPIKKIQEHAPITEEEFLGDNFPHISRWEV